MREIDEPERSMTSPAVRYRNDAKRQRSARTSPLRNGKRLHPGPTSVKSRAKHFIPSQRYRARYCRARVGREIVGVHSVQARGGLCLL